MPDRKIKTMTGGISRAAEAETARYRFVAWIKADRTVVDCSLRAIR